MRSLLLLLLTSTVAFSEIVSFGVKGGVPLTDAFKISGGSTFFSDKQPYTIGPVLELNLPFRLSVEFDALYKPLEYGSNVESISPDGRTLTSMRTTGSSWQFPLLLKYRLTGGLLRPYLGAGFAFHRLSGLKQLTGRAGDPSPVESSEPRELIDSSGMGAVLGGGLELRVPFIRLSSEIRYTRWGSMNFRSVAGDFRSHANQAEFLLGITF